MYEGNNYYYVKNCLGDVIAVVDSNYKEHCTYDYDARGNIKDKDNLLYAICETYSYQFELIKKFCNKVGVNNYEVRNDYELYNWIGEHIYEDTYSRENHLYYWKDDNDRYHIYIDYRESTTKMVIS
ncbi:MAG: hypothetical protein K6G26_08755 [Lachnospiraceae bacterium]|nr:hypothetical protein [Lachnospiraceae bacterium]